MISRGATPHSHPEAKLKWKSPPKTDRQSIQFYKLQIQEIRKTPWKADPLLLSQVDTIILILKGLVLKVHCMFQKKRATQPKLIG